MAAGCYHSGARATVASTGLRVAQGWTSSFRSRAAAIPLGHYFTCDKGYQGMDSGLILIVDDEFSVRHGLSTTLHTFGFNAVTASRGKEALPLVCSAPFDAVLLDNNLPGMSGIDTCRRMRRLLPRIPILMLSERDEEDDSVEALDAGADDFVTKPFQLRVLVARIRAAMRWSKLGPGLSPDEGVPVLQVGGIELDLVRRTLKKPNREVHLTPKEFELTRQLMIHAGRPVAHSQLLCALWGTDHGRDPEHLRTFVHLLRKKIEDDPSSPKYLLTDTQFGYHFAESE
jgi:two-component system KDP operon response regulator KdpE